MKFGKEKLGALRVLLMTDTNTPFDTSPLSESRLAIVGQTFVDKVLRLKEPMIPGRNHSFVSQEESIGGLYNAINCVAKSGVTVDIYSELHDKVSTLALGRDGLSHFEVPGLGIVEAYIVIEKSGERTSFVPRDGFRHDELELKDDYDLLSIFYLDFFDDPEALVSKTRLKSKLIGADLARNVYSQSYAAEIMNAIAKLDFVVCSESEIEALGKALQFSGNQDKLLNYFSESSTSLCVHSPERLLILSGDQDFFEVDQPKFEAQSLLGLGDKFFGLVMLGITKGLDFMTSCVEANSVVRRELQQRVGKDV